MAFPPHGSQKHRPGFAQSAKRHGVNPGPPPWLAMRPCGGLILMSENSRNPDGSDPTSSFAGSETTPFSVLRNVARNEFSYGAGFS